MTGIVLTIALILVGLSAGLLIVALADWWHTRGGRR